jgi:predicted metal-binding membrane protein
MAVPVEAREVPQLSRRWSPTADRVAVPAALLVVAGVGWWWSWRMSSMDMDMEGPLSVAGFLVAWLAMMTAMMFPAVIPVVRLYARAAARGTVAPLPVFVAGYIVVWTAIGLPVYWVWRSLMLPLDVARPWAGRLAGTALVAAAIWQLTPLKSVCLRHCRSPMSFFMRSGRRLGSVTGAVRAGATHGLFCLGCCWALMAVLVALGTMNVWWMVGLAALIFVEKNAPWGETAARTVAVAFAVAGVVLLVHPVAVRHLI